MGRKRIRIDVRKIVGEHPVTNSPIDLKWYRSASRYNNGATLYGSKYRMRYLIAYSKQKPYTERELEEYKIKQEKESTHYAE
jgi:hypothetical protein